MNLGDRFAFLSGLPRTGSTLLSTLLSQHPDIHTTGSSSVREIINQTHNFRLGESPHFDHSDPKSQVWGMMRGALIGAYSEVDEGKIILEKDRGWASNIPRLSRLISSKPRIIATVRPVTEVISSFICLADRSGGQSKIDEISRSLGWNPQLGNHIRTRVIWEKYIYPNWRVLKTGWEYSTECFLLLSYKDITTRPQRVIDSVCEFLDLESFSVKTEKLSNPNPENDAVYGLPGLHDIREKLERVSPPAEQVLGNELYEKWSARNLDFWTH